MYTSCMGARSVAQGQPLTSRPILPAVVATMKFNRAAFTRSILEGFKPLAPEFHLRRTARVYAYEHVDVYASDDVKVRIFVAHPELPHVVISVDSSPPREYHYSPAKHLAASKERARYYRALDNGQGATELYRQVASAQVASVGRAIQAIRSGKRVGSAWKRRP